MEHDLHRVVGEHRRQWRGVEALERVEHRDLAADTDLDQAQQRPVPALGHELGVDAEAPLSLRALGQPFDVVHAPGEGNCCRMRASQARSGSTAWLAIRSLAEGVTV
jgi:hypothetical protein